MCTATRLGHGNESHRFASTARMVREMPPKIFIIPLADGESRRERLVSGLLLIILYRLLREVAGSGQRTMIDLCTSRDRHMIFCQRG